MDLGIRDKIAVVTGTAQGLGRTIAVSMACEGAVLALADINESKCMEVVREVERLGRKCIFIKCDISCAGDIANLVNSVIREYGGIDILVNNAGICPRTKFDEISSEEWDKVLGINLKGIFLLSQNVINYMKRQKSGKIVNMASAAGKIGGAQVGAHYSVSKAGVICLTKTLALEGAGYGINANAVCPGVIETEMTMSISNEQIEKYKRMIPLGRLGTTQDVANAVLFLVSKAADYITGEIMDVNGGFIMD